MKSPNDDKDSFRIDEEIAAAPVPPGVDRRTFMMRSAVIGSAAVVTGRALSAEEQSKGAVAPPPKVAMSPDLNVVKKSKGAVMTTIEEFYKVGPGPSS